MSGHSHWATIRRKKGSADAKKGKQFSKIAKQIITAVRHGGPNPDDNLKLQYAIQEARSISMPKDTIQNAIKKGAGEKDGASDYIEAVYEGFGPAGVSVIIATLTDNTNRTGPEVRKILEKRGGKSAPQGSVSYKFDNNGLITVKTEVVDEDELLELMLDLGAEDVSTNSDDGVYEIITSTAEFYSVVKALEEKEIPTEVAEITMIPQTQIDIDSNTAEKLLALMDDLDEHDDVQKVYTDANFPT